MWAESREAVEPVPTSLLLDYFHRSTEVLGRYARKSVLIRSNVEEQPPSIEELRRLLIQVQMDVLHDVVNDYNSSTNNADNNSSKDIAMSIENVQLALRKVGQNEDDEDDDADDTLRQPMQQMHNAARNAFARSVLTSYQLDLDSYVHNTEDEEATSVCDRYATRQELLEYFGLFIVAVEIDEVQCYISSGEPIDFSGNAASLQQAKAREASISSPEKRLSLLQSLILRAVLGQSVIQDPIAFVVEAATRILSPDDTNAEQWTNNDDEEFSQALDNYMSAIRVCRENASAFSNLSDYDQDGVTRVVSVKYSEKSYEENTTASMPPQSSFMTEHKESEQRKDLVLARRAAEMQQTLLAQLLMMEDAERLHTLREAKEAHDEFLHEALSIPSGPQRVLFVQSVDEEKQKKLIMHKLWESMLASNGGVPPTIHHHQTP